MPLKAGQYIDLYDSSSELDPSDPLGQLAITLSPLTLWVNTATGWVAVATPSGVPPAAPPASETGQGVVELATQSEIESGSAGVLVANVARLKAELDRRIVPGAWIAPTLLNSWVNTAGNQVAGYRKTPWGEVQLRGVVEGGTITNGTAVLNLPAGYRPASSRQFIALQGGNAACRIIVLSGGNVTIEGVTSNSLLSLESVRFDV